MKLSHQQARLTHAVVLCQRSVSLLPPLPASRTHHHRHPGKMNMPPPVNTRDPSMAAQPFVHLHNHTDYSLLDGACEIDQLMQVVGAQKMPAVAMTDHGNLFGAVR